MEFKITNTWDSSPVCHEGISLSLKPGDEGILFEVNGPFFNDPLAPPGEKGKPFNQLWDYEVAEAFFLNSISNQYLEVELCPHGQHLVLLLSGRRKVWQHELSLTYESSTNGQKWEGRALIPWSYFPPAVNNFNAYAIHGSGAARVYEALYPVPKHEVMEGQEPDFHRLEYFKDFNLKSTMKEDWEQPNSDLWESASGIRS
ncbi:UPF0462 protein C4orf33 homolog isoform X2 [Callorhinchus milii]|nr:UPF0462 protein C4orf33 homolog isoform X2 [Callorhinchus milii]XP_042194870.1 UPF0462 protein C4orf33 homolog isoform X2 [Callorhinchus milii]XP_042194871.1 UPF0462 protein C4orf33 homolog isoform X2 [Callorhinchus milii]XP_042194874.1 UPF0462 protein C4orf33 homolog isoform X2 [Callorhinchus milii]|eukprot:gi/632959922/ref/XP_007895899.1/ PREDICTED: UPF0462 protein C4orf33 homolog isoform X2 [Callorhinchus milii]